MRKLATVRIIKELRPIPKADFIELALIDGWQCVVKKGEFKEGDKCVYFEIDSVLPEREWSLFMQERKYRVKTIKLRKQLSQGLALPLETVGAVDRFSSVGDDLTVLLGVKLFEVPSKDNTSLQRKPVPYKWMMRFGVTRWLHMKMFPRKKGSWPEYLPKTDEERIQNIQLDMYTKGDMYMTEKLDGQSCSFFYARLEKVGWSKRGMYGVCSRNMWLKVKDQSNWWRASEDLNIEKRLKQYCMVTSRSLAIQGELCGDGIQGNKLDLKGRKYYVYNVYDIERQKYLSYDEKQMVISDLSLETVPVIITDVNFSSATKEELIAAADGKSTLGNKSLREGLVFRRMNDDSVSFKAISNKFLLKHGD